MGGWTAAGNSSRPRPPPPSAPSCGLGLRPAAAALPPDKGSKGVAPRAVFHPWLGGLQHFKGQVGRALRGVLAFPLIPGEGEGGSLLPLPEGWGLLASFHRLSHPCSLPDPLPSPGSSLTRPPTTKPNLRVLRVTRVKEDKAEPGKTWRRSEAREGQSLSIQVEPSVILEGAPRRVWGSRRNTHHQDSG